MRVDAGVLQLRIGCDLLRSNIVSAFTLPLSCSWKVELGGLITFVGIKSNLQMFVPVRFRTRRETPSALDAAD